jgi:hypothetical protein
LPLTIGSTPFKELLMRSSLAIASDAVGAASTLRWLFAPGLGRLRRLRLATAILLPALLGLAAPALAGDEMALHGYCAGAGQCIHNDVNTPTTQNPVEGFGFTLSGAGPNQLRGDLTIVILVPNAPNLNPAGSSQYTITGSANTSNTQNAAPTPITPVIATQTPGQWTSGTLSQFLQLDASPNNPIGAYLPSTQLQRVAATGFNVFTGEIDGTWLYGPSKPNTSPLLDLTESLPIGSYIVGFLNRPSGSTSWIATANSGAIFFAPEPCSMGLLVGGLAAYGLIRRRRRRKRAA